MSDLLMECYNRITLVQKLLTDNQKWILRYDEYAKEIRANADTIKDYKNKFHEWAPLYLYMNVSKAKGNMSFSLRYQGQDVAVLKVINNIPLISTLPFDDKNKTYFGCNISLDNCEWRSDNAKEFRKFFTKKPLRNNTIKKNEEHRIESLLLTEFSKRDSKNKALLNIQPVKLLGINRFQMPTPITASNSKLAYSKSNGGGIDILARTGTGNSIKLCVIEVKDENKPTEPPVKVVLQALAYATFIQQLLRSKSGNEWWKLFGFNRKLPDKIQINVVCAMPSINNNDTSFAGIKIPVENDFFHIHYIYFQEKDNEIERILTSIG